MKHQPDQLKQAAAHVARLVIPGIDQNVVTCVVFIEKGTGLAGIAHNGDTHEVMRALSDIAHTDSLVIRGDA